MRRGGRGLARIQHISKTESFATIVNGIEMLTIVRNLSIVDLSGGSGYNSAIEIEALNGLIS